MLKKVRFRPSKLPFHPSAESTPLQRDGSAIGGSALVGMMTTAARKGLLFVYNIAFVRFLGVDLYATYVASDSIFRPLSLVAALGGPSLAIKEVAEARAGEDAERVTAHRLSAITLVTLGIGVLLAVGVALLAAPLARMVGGGAVLVTSLRWTSGTIALLALANVAGGMLVGAGRVRSMFTLTNLVEGGARFVVLGIIALVLLGRAASWWAIWIPEVVGAVVVIGAAWWILHRATLGAGLSLLAGIGGVARTLVFGAPLVVHGLSSMAFDYVDKIMVAGIVRDRTALAAYSVAVFLGSLLPLFHRSLTTAVSPAISEAIARGDRPAALRLYRESAVLSFQLCGLTYLGLILLGHEVLGLYGPAYQPYLFVLALVGWGDLVDTFAGCGGYLLIARERGHYLAYNAIATIALNIALNFVLISRFGPIGAAGATVLSQAIKNGLILWQNWRIDGMHPLTLPHLAALATLVGLTTGFFLLRMETLGFPLRLAIGTAVGAFALLTLYRRYRRFVRAIHPSRAA